jgi:ubiquinone/menaquinone biosynthesis C-methylase UbiE
MKKNRASEHRAAIIDQFSRQALPFSQQPAHSQEGFLNLLLSMSGVGAQDTVLDVACGPGLVAAAFAARAKHVTGIDITPAMIARAEQIQRDKHLTNMSWRVGTVLPLPYADASFSLVVTRYSFHHFLDPMAVFAEMVRVCTPGGMVIVTDVIMSPDKREFFDYEEKLRDPSHSRTLTPDELLQMTAQLHLREIKTQFFRSARNLEAHLKASFPHPGNEEKVRKIFQKDIGRDDLGLGAHWQGNEVHFAYPVMVMAGRRP